MQSSASTAHSRLLSFLTPDNPDAPELGTPAEPAEPVAYLDLVAMTAFAANTGNASSAANLRRSYSALSRRPLSQESWVLQNAIVQLPVSMEYYAILSLLESYSIVAIAAGTGTGKTTQVPQILADFVRNRYNKSPSHWLGRVVVALPTRVAAELLFKRLSVETDCESPGNWIALRIGNKEFHIGESGAFLTIVTHGYLTKALDAKFLNGIAFLVLDESQQRSLEISFCKAILKISRGDTRLVFMGAGLNVEALEVFFDQPIGSMVLQGRQYGIQRFSLPALSTELPRHSYDFEILRRVELLTRAEMRSSRGCILVFVKGKIDTENLAKALKQADWTTIACHAESDRGVLKTIKNMSADPEGYVIVGTSYLESAVTLPAVRTVVCSCRVNSSIGDTDGVSSNLVRWCSIMEIHNQSGRTGRLCDGKVLLAVPEHILPALPPSEAASIEDLRGLALELARRHSNFHDLQWPLGENPVSHRFRRAVAQLHESRLVNVLPSACGDLASRLHQLGVSCSTASERGADIPFEQACLSLTSTGHSMYELSPLSSLHLRTFVSLCEGAGFGYQGAAAASLLDNMVGRNPFAD